MKRKYKATNRKGVMDSPLLSPVLGRRFQMSFLHDMGAFLMFIVVTLFYMSPQGYADVGIQGMGVVNVHSPALIHGTDLNNSFFWTQRRLHEPDKTSDVTGDHADSSPLYLGAMAPLTGRHGSLGRRLVHAWIMAVDWINENFGGIRIGNVTHPVVIEVYDDHSQAEKVANLTEFLVQDDNKYVALLGPYSSTLTAVAAPIADRSNKLLIANGAAVEDIFEGKNTFSTTPPASDYLRFGLPVLASGGVHTAIIITEEGDLFTNAACNYDADAFIFPSSGQGQDRPTIDLIEHIQVKVTDDEEFNMQEVSRALDFIEQEDPDVVVGCLFYASCKMLVQLSEKRKITMRNSIFTHCTADPLWDNDMVSGDQAKRGRFVLGQTVWDPRAPRDPSFFQGQNHFCVNQSCLSPFEFEQKFLEQFGELPPYQSALHFSGVETLFWAIFSAQSTKTADIKRELKDNEFPTVAGRIEFGANHQSRGSRHMFVQYDAADKYHIVSPDFLSSRQIIMDVPTWEQRECERNDRCDRGSCDPDGSCSCDSGWIGSSCSINLVPIAVTPSLFIFLAIVAWQGRLFYRNKKLQKLQKHQEKLRKEQELVDTAAKQTHTRLLSYALHELANPLFVVSALLESKSGSEMNIARGRIFQMQRVLKDMQLSRDRLRSGGLNLYCESVDISSFLRDVQHRLRTIHELSVEIFLDKDCFELSFFTDGLRTRQLATDVVANIARLAKYPEKGGGCSSYNTPSPSVETCIFVCLQNCVVSPSEPSESLVSEQNRRHISPILNSSETSWSQINGSLNLPVFRYLSFAILPRDTLEQILGEAPSPFFQWLGHADLQAAVSINSEEPSFSGTNGGHVEIDVGLADSACPSHMEEQYRQNVRNRPDYARYFVKDMMSLEIQRRLKLTSFYLMGTGSYTVEKLPPTFTLSREKWMTVKEELDLIGLQRKPSQQASSDSAAFSPRQTSNSPKEVDDTLVDSLSTDDSSQISTYGKRAPLRVLKEDSVLHSSDEIALLNSNFFGKSSSYLDFAMSLSSCQTLAERMGGSVEFSTEECGIAAIHLPLFCSLTDISMTSVLDCQYDSAQLREVIERSNGNGKEKDEELNATDSECVERQTSNPTNSDRSQLRGTAKVLICDDERINVKLVRRMLARAGISCGCVHDGDEIPDELQKALADDEPYNIILLDIVMKRTNGITVCQALRKKYGQELKVIAMTANATAEDIEIYKKTGFDACLAKPFSSEDLYKCLFEESEFT